MKPRSVSLKPWLGIFLLAGLASSNAQIIAGYDFGTPSSGTLGATVETGVTASVVSGSGAAADFILQQTLGDNTGTYVGAAGVSAFGSSEAGNFSGTANDATGGSLADAITDGDYVTFTLTASAPGTLRVSGFSIAGAIAGPKGAEFFNVVAQVNGGTTWEASGALFAADQEITALQGLSDWDDFFADVSTNPTLQGIDSVEFRIYFWGGSGNTSSSRTDFDQIVVEGTIGAAPPTWQLDGSGSWSTPANWDPSVPNAASAKAIFSDSIPLTGPLTAGLDVAVTLGDLSIFSAQPITIGGSSVLTLDGGGAASISATVGSHVVSADVSLVDPLEVNFPSGAALNISGALTGTTSVTNSGNGQLTLSGDLSSHTGSITSNAGSLVVSGTGSRDITATAGTLEVSGTGVGDITVDAGVIFSGEGSHTGTLNLAADSILSVDPTNGASAFTTGTFSPTAEVNLEFTSSPIGLGAFTILNYTTYGGTVADDFGGSSYRLTLTDTGSSITGTVAAAETSTWTGTDGVGGFFFWNNGVNTNWTSSDSLFFRGDSVTFGDTGAGFVDVNSGVAPATVNFTNTSGNNYTVEDVTADAETISATTGGINLTGDGDAALNVKITGNTDITHSGAGTLVIGAGVNNDFVGDVAVNGGGTLVVGSNNFLGGLSNTITIGSGSTLDLNGVGNGADNFQAYDENTFILEGGATLTNPSTTVLNQAFTDQLQFGGDVTLSGNHRIDIFGNINVTGTDITVTLDYVQPAGNIGSVIGGDNSGESIALWHVVEGTLFVNTAGSLGDNALVRVEDGGIFRGNGGTAAGDWTTINNVFLEAGSQIQKRDQDNVFNLDGTITVEGDTAISPGGGGDTIALNAAITGAGNVTFNNTGNLRLGTGFDDSGLTGDLIIGDGGANKNLQLADLDVGVAETTTLSADVIINEPDANQFDLQVDGMEDTMTLSGVISGSGGAGLQKTGLGTAILSGDNTFTGDTTVTEGTLEVGGNALSDSDSLIIDFNGSVAVTGGGTETVDTLSVGGDLQMAGTYTNADFFEITSGSIEVLSDPGFAGWIIGDFTNGTVPVDQQGPDDDWDNDGTNNLLEYALDGFDPTVSDGNTSTSSGSTVIYTKRAEAVTNGDIFYDIEESTDLGINDAWEAVTPDIDDAAEISYTLPAPGPAKDFVRLNVTQN